MGSAEIMSTNVAYPFYLNIFSLVFLKSNVIFFSISTMFRLSAETKKCVIEHDSNQT